MRARKDSRGFGPIESKVRAHRVESSEAPRPKLRLGSARVAGSSGSAGPHVQARAKVQARYRGGDQLEGPGAPRGLAPGQGPEAVGAAQAAAIEDERGRSRRARLQAALRKPLQPRPCHRATEPPLCAPQDQFHAEAAGKRLGQGPLNPTRVFAFLKEPGQFFEEDEWTNPDSSMTCAAACPSLVGPRTPGREWSPRTVARSALLRRSKARLSKNFAWAVDAKGRQAPVTAHLPAYRLAFDLAATDACVW